MKSTADYCVYYAVRGSTLRICGWNPEVWPWYYFTKTLLSCEIVQNIVWFLG